MDDKLALGSETKLEEISGFVSPSESIKVSAGG